MTAKEHHNLLRYRRMYDRTQEENLQLKTELNELKEKYNNLNSLYHKIVDAKIIDKEGGLNYELQL